MTDTELYLTLALVYLWLMGGAMVCHGIAVSKGKALPPSGRVITMLFWPLISAWVSLEGAFTRVR